MDKSRSGGVPAVSVLLPASNEEGLIGACLGAIAATDWDAPFEVIVVANGCRDDTAGVARDLAPVLAGRQCCLRVIERAEGDKLGALNAADAAARAGIRVYLDADVLLGARVLPELHAALNLDAPRYASGQVRIPRPASRVSRAYARIYARVPFMTHGVPGCGLFALNAAGRARFGDWPDIISDDTFARLNFAPGERVGVDASYDWPLVEGWGNLVRVRRRQNSGVNEVAARYPRLMRNDDKPPFPLWRKIALALRDPSGFAVYAGVAAAVRLSPARPAGWSRGR